MISFTATAFLPWILCEGLVLEVCSVPVRQFLTDGLEIQFCVGSAPPGAVCIADPTHDGVPQSHLLLVFVVAVEIALVVTRDRSVAQAVAELFCHRYIAEVAAILCDGTTVLVAVGPHR